MVCFDVENLVHLTGSNVIPRRGLGRSEDGMPEIL